MHGILYTYTQACTKQWERQYVYMLYVTDVTDMQHDKVPHTEMIENDSSLVFGKLDKFQITPHKMITQIILELLLGLDWFLRHS